MLVFESQVLEFLLYLVESESVSQRGVDVQGLAGYLILLFGPHGGQGAHVVQAVGHLDEHYADVGSHGQQQFAEVLGLQRCLRTEDAARNLGQALDDGGYLVAEIVLDVLAGVFCVLHHVVEQGRADGCGTEAQFGNHDLGHGYGMEDVGLATATPHALVGLAGETVGALYFFYFLAMVALKVRT